MPQKSIPFASGQQSGSEALGGATPLVVNLFVDQTGSMKVRPGISAWSGFPTTIPNASPVDAMAVFNGQLIYVTQDRKLWVVQSPGIVVALSDTTAATKLDGSTRPVPVVTKTRVVFAGGGQPQKWEGSGLSSRLLGLNTLPPLPSPPSPPNTTHLASVATHLIGIDRAISGNASGRYYWSNPFESGNEVWDPLNFAEAASRPDPAVALYDTGNQIFAFGSSTLEILRADPSTGGFVTSRAIDVGCMAPYSVIRFDYTMAWLADKRRFVMSTGNDMTAISDLLTSTIDAFQNIDDAFGFELRRDSWRQLCWVFGTEGRTLSYDPTSKLWAELKSFDSIGYTPLAVTSSIQWEDQNLGLVGLPTGQIAKWDPLSTTDLGQPIKAEVVTGYQARDTGNKKLCNGVHFVFKRGVGIPGSNPTVQVSWRDDGGAFSNPCVIPLGAAGDSDPVVRLRSLGTYRMRQWRLEFTDMAAFTFVGAQEDYTVLDS
jgi:hypothetical protein